MTNSLKLLRLNTEIYRNICNVKECFMDKFKVLLPKQYFLMKQLIFYFRGNHNRNFSYSNVNSV